MTGREDLPGSDSFVTEVGIRQAWLFVTMCDNSPERSAETRLFLDTSWTLGGHRFDLDSDELESGLLKLCQLLNRTLESSAALADGGLVLDFGNDTRLEIDSVGAAATTHDIWWLGTVGGTSQSEGA